MNMLIYTIRRYWKFLLACCLFGLLAGCYTALQDTGVRFDEDMVWWPDSPPTKLAETEPGTYAQNQVVRAGEEFPAEYLKEEARK